MAKLLSMARFSLRPNLAAALPSPTLLHLHRLFLSSSFSINSTPYPLYYELIDYRPTPESLAPRRRRRLPPPLSKPDSTPEEPEGPTPPERGFGDWVDRKLSALDRAGSNDPGMDKSERKYYNKRRKRMYGSDSDGDGDRDRELVELKPEVYEFRNLHEREEELYFYDAFANPWEQEKHYRMVYQLEKKFFPDQCFDKAFLAPGEYEAANAKANANANGRKKGDEKKKGGVGDDKAMIFFEGDKDEKGGDAVKDPKEEVSEKKVADFFKCSKKVPDQDGEVCNGEPYLLTRSRELPPTWDGPFGTVVLVDKPKGWTSFTVCGKLRRLVNVKKVGHAGTLDPMATGLLIVCVGKATKIVDSYQGMIKGYSGVFRLGEATSTWDADSAVIQREPWEHIKDVDIKKVAASFCGEIWQVPPMFSAIKVGGERMYDRARRGQNMELSPRRISIFQFDIERSLDNRQNLIFRVTCSKGTYIRSLCADFGKAVGSCAHLTALRRDSIGQYSADDAWDFRKLEEAVTKEYL